MSSARVNGQRSQLEIDTETFMSKLAHSDGLATSTALIAEAKLRGLLWRCGCRTLNYLTHLECSQCGRVNVSKPEQ